MKATDTASAAIQATARELRLPGIREHQKRLADQAKRSKPTYLEFLAATLTLEVDDRTERRRTRRVTEARFPRPKRLADFDLGAAPTVNPATIATLAAGNYIDTGDPVVMLGDSGTGKTHLLIGLGMAACEQARRVRYTTCAQLANELNEAADERRLARLINKYSRIELLIIDELGYVQLDTRGAELFFQVLTDRDEKSSTAIGSNLPFSEWGQIITDPRLASAVIDRLTFNAHIIETGTNSYRLKTSHTNVTRMVVSYPKTVLPAESPTRRKSIQASSKIVADR